MARCRNSHNPMNKSAGKGKTDRRQTKMTANWHSHDKRPAPVFYLAHR